MHRTPYAVALLAAFAGLCQAQTLDTRETDFVVAVSKVAGFPTPDVEKESDAEGTILEMEFEDEFELRLVRYTDPAMAREAAAYVALNSGMGDAPSFTELRGGDVLVIEGPLASGDLAEKLRAAAWKAFPWDAPSKTTSLIMLNLLEDGLAIRTSSSVTQAYRYTQGLVNEVIDDAQDADPDSDTVYEVISPREVRMSNGEQAAHAKITDAAAMQVVRSVDAPAKVLVEFSKLIELPIETKAKAQAGATDALGTLGN